MICKTKHPVFFGMAMVCLFLVGVGGAHATVITEATSRFDWSTFTIGLDPGMSLRPADVQGRVSHAAAFTHFSSPGFADSDSRFAADWSTNLNADAASTSATYSLSGSGRVDADNDTLTGMASFDGTGLFWGTGNELLQAQGSAQRDFKFSVSGSGVITFSVDYLHDTSASNTGPDTGRAVATSVLSLNSLNNANGRLLDPDLADEAVAAVGISSYADALWRESVFDSDFGTLSLGATVGDGAEMLFIAQAFSSAYYEVPKQAVPAAAITPAVGRPVRVAPPRVQANNSALVACAVSLSLRRRHPVPSRAGVRPGSGVSPSSALPRSGIR